MAESDQHPSLKDSEKAYVRDILNSLRLSHQPKKFHVECVVGPKINRDYDRIQNYMHKMSSKLEKFRVAVRKDNLKDYYKEIEKVYDEFKGYLDIYEYNLNRDIIMREVHKKSA